MVDARLPILDSEDKIPLAVLPDYLQEAALDTEYGGDGGAPSVHDHDTRYYTEAEVDAKIEAATGGIVIAGILDPGEDPAPGTPAGSLFIVRDAASTGGGGGGGTTPSAITWVAGDFPTGTSSLSNATATIPATAVVGDFMLALWTIGTQAADNYTLPTGWTPIFSQNVSTNLTVKAFYRFTQTGDAGSAVVGGTPAGGTRQTMAIGVWRGVLGVDAWAVAAESVSTVSHVTPALTTVADQCAVVAIAADRSDGLTTWTAPAGYTERGETFRSGTGGKTSTIADKLTQVDAGTAVGGATFTASVAGAVAATAVLSLSPILV